MHLCNLYLLRWKELLQHVHVIALKVLSNY